MSASRRASGFSRKLRSTAGNTMESLLNKGQSDTATALRAHCKRSRDASSRGSFGLSRTLSVDDVDCSMVLFHAVVAIVPLAEGDRRDMLRIEAPDGCGRKRSRQCSMNVFMKFGTFCID